MGNSYRKEYERRIYKVQNYIAAHMDQDLSLEVLAGVAAFSPYHFHRIFKSIAGETLYDFIQRTRLERACMILGSTSEESITEIAMHCGFANSSSFSKAFSRQYGISPSLYRLENRGPAKVQSSNSDSASHEKSCTFSVTVNNLPTFRLAYFRNIGPYGPENSKLMEKIMTWAGARDLLAKGGHILGIPHDDPEITPPEKCRFDCGIIIPGNFPLDGAVNEMELSGGKYAFMEVEQRAESVSSGWQAIFKDWLPESGFQVDNRRAFERYTISEEDQSKALRWEICIPLRPL